nr:MAG: polyprotein 2 [Picornavirales sp.]
MYDEFLDTRTLVPSNTKMDFDKFIDKPFLIGTYNWASTHVKWTEIQRLRFPSVMYTSNEPATVPFKLSCLYQAQMCCMLQLAGTPSHQGCVMVAAVPVDTPVISHPNQILSAPHVFLNGNEATPVCLECPMYSQTSLLKTSTSTSQPNKTNTINYGDMFELVIFNMNPLSAASGASTTLSLSVHAIIKRAEFYIPKNGDMPYTEFTPQVGFIDYVRKVPTRIIDSLATGLKAVAGDAIDALRAGVQLWTGFHNPNIPVIEHRMLSTHRNFANNVDVPVRYEVMDNHAQFSRILDDYYFRTTQDEMDIRYLLDKPVYVGSFNVKSTDTTGKLLMTLPITPFVEMNIAGGVLDTAFHSPMRSLYEASCYWRGGLKLHLQAVMTNFHYTKLVVYKDYSTALGTAWSSVPAVPLYDAVHNLNLDTIEFSSGGQIETIDLPYASMSKQLPCTKDVVAAALQHGKLYVYLVQPLVYNNNVPTTITINAYISGGNDLEFSGYGTDNYRYVYGDIPTFSAQSGVLVDTQDQSQIASVTPVTYKEETGMSLRPNTSIRDYLRMMIPSTARVVSSPVGLASIVAIPVSSLLIPGNNSVINNMELLSTLYYGMSGGIKIKFRIDNVKAASLTYMPPNVYSLGEATAVGENVTHSCVPFTTVADSALQAVVVSQGDFDPVDQYPSPYIEINDMSRAHTVGNIVMLEAAIPNMSPYNFVGSASKWSARPLSILDDLGTIYIRCLRSTDDVATNVIRIHPFVGFNDETRLGYQVYAPKKRISTVTLTTGVVVRDSPYVRPNNISPTLGGLPVTGLPSTIVYYAT